MTKQEQLLEHQRWKLRPQFADAKWFDDLLTNEFASAESQFRWMCRALEWVIPFAAQSVPYYRNLWGELGIEPGDIQAPDDLPKLPVLTRRDLIDSFELLRAERLPTGVRLRDMTKSSGTTGPPVVVLSTDLNTKMFTLLWQRQARCFRMDPTGTLCEIRYGGDVELQSDGSPNPDGNIVRLPRWRHLGRCFHTGLYVGFNITNDHEQQVRWLKQLQPDYVVTDASMLEELALAAGGRVPSESIQAVVAVASQVDHSMRKRLERMYGVLVHETYGLNEIGKVAIRCREGRYHVHSEHCHVEIVDNVGQPTAPGEVGRIVVTSLRNPAMPLIRYDTGDLATAVAGSCPCGRSLPSFGTIVGRYRRYAGLPEGTRERFDAIQNAVADQPIEALQFLRQFQLHQFRDNRFELRLTTDGPIPESFSIAVRDEWSKVNGAKTTELHIVRVENIPRSAGGKARDFTSDYYD